VPLVNIPSLKPLKSEAQQVPEQKLSAWKAEIVISRQAWPQGYTGLAENIEMKNFD
jgi:hypothetical protein